MGVGLVSRYRYSDSEKWRDLQQDIESQISTYLPEFGAVKVEVTSKDRKFIIQISIDGIIYGYEYNTTTTTLSDIKSS